MDNTLPKDLFATKSVSNNKNSSVTELPKDLFVQVINSNEYKNMVLVNQKTFDAIELARYGNITAKEVDNTNMERFFCKKKLQEKFFDGKLVEVKTQHE